MDHFQVAVQFNICTRLAGVDDVISLARMLASRGFLPAEPPNDPKPSRDIEALVRHWWKPRPGFRADEPFYGHPQYEVFFRIVPVRSPELLTTFRCQFYGLKFSSVTIGGIVALDSGAQTWSLESYAQALLELALRLYPQLGPRFGWVDDNEADGRWVKEIGAMKLTAIGWANFFGPEYVERFGRKFLMGMPGWKVEELDDGGVFHQLAPSLVESDAEGAKELRAQVVEHWRKAGLQVQCQAPYVLLPDGQAQEAAEAVVGYGTDEELLEYLRLILCATLVLKDGTRVKPIYVEWALLTREQRQITLSSIRQAAIAEIRQYRGKRIRFEFNEIPLELDQMMRELVGVNNPGFAYSQVDMK